MNNILFKIVTLTFGLLACRSSGTFHDGFAVCKKKDPNFGKCLDSAIENGIKYLKAGLPDYNIPPLDPFHLASLTVGAGSGAVNLVQHYSNVVMTGFIDLKVNESSVDFENKILRYSTMHPLLVQKAQYDINGKILMLPVKGKGPCTLSLENTFSKHEIQFQEIEKEGEIYYIPKSYSLKMSPDHARYLLEDLFDGNKLLGDNINKLINDEWLAIYSDVEDKYEKSYAKFFLDFTKNIFEKVSLNNIFIP